MKSYIEAIRGYKLLMNKIEGIPLGNFPAQHWPPVKPNKPAVVGLWAHPDDETLSGGPLSVRLRNMGSRVVDIPVTLGRPEQYARRRVELENACKHLGIDLLYPTQNGLRDQIKSDRPDDWNFAVNSVREILEELKPKVIITHHDDDGHHDHIKTNQLAVAAMRQIPDLDCVFVESQYWKDMAKPNLQLEISDADLATLLEALSCHREELVRNRYDKFWLPYAHNNARYGEVVTGWGTPAAEFWFSAMYRVRRFRGGQFEDFLFPLQLAANEPISRILPSDWV